MSEPIIASQIVVTQLYDEDGEEMVTVGTPEGMEMPRMTVLVGLLTRAAWAAQINGVLDLSGDEDEDG